MPLAATMPGSCFIVFTAPAVEMAADASVARGSVMQRCLMLSHFLSNACHNGQCTFNCLV